MYVCAYIDMYIDMYKDMYNVCICLNMYAYVDIYTCIMKVPFKTINDIML